MNPATVTQPYPEAPPMARQYTITPRNADLWDECPFRTVKDRATTPSKGLRMGNAIHELLKLDARRMLSGRPHLQATELVATVTAHSLWRDDNEFLDLAISCIVGARTFIDDEELVPLRAEQYVRSAYRDISGESRLQVRFSGRIDLVARRAEGRLVLVDYKTGMGIPSPLDLIERPSSFVYTYLGRCLRDQDQAIGRACSPEIEIVQVLPHLGQSSHVRLTRDELQSGARRVRDMAIGLDTGVHAPSPGEQCAYCPLGDECPARPGLAPWEREPL